MKTSELNAENNLQQHILDEMIDWQKTDTYATDDVIRTHLADMSSNINPLYNYFGMAVSDATVDAEYQRLKDGIRNELAALNDAGFGLDELENWRDWIGDERWPEHESQGMKKYRFRSKVFSVAIQSAAQYLADQYEWEN